MLTIGIMHALYSGTFGFADPLRIRLPDVARAIDREIDADFDDTGGRAMIERLARELPRRRVQVFMAVDPSRAYDIRLLVASLLECRHVVNVHIDTDKGVGRTAKINRTVADRSVLAGDLDWFVVIDDDVAIGPGFLDRFIAACEAAALVVAQPAHRIHSHASYDVTQRRPRSLVRQTNFVEVGPVLALHQSVFGQILPLPETRWGWGADFLWADIARRRGWRIGVVDGATIEHLRPVGLENARAAMEEASEMLASRGVGMIGRVEMLSPGRVILTW